tara:strand:- start:295 stop:753 length:459 start_codon:yes stop_codon:yes gene_type:complete
MTVEKNLNRWFKEKWVDVSRKKKDGTHPPCGRSKAKTSSKGYPKCRPSVKVSSKTPKTSGSMSSGQKRAATKRKRSKKQGVGGKPTIVKAMNEAWGFMKANQCPDGKEPRSKEEALRIQQDYGLRAYRCQRMVYENGRSRVIGCGAYHNTGS